MLSDETITIFGSPQGKRPSGEKRGKEFGPVLGFFVFLPLLAIVALLQLPALAVAIPWQKWKHRRFVARMKAQRRVMIWSDFARCMEGKRGTLLIEGSEIKWLNWWWTEEDVLTVSPHAIPERTISYNRKKRRTFLPFREWCYTRYTNPTDGRAFLVLGEIRPKVNMLESNTDANVVTFQPLSPRLARRVRARVRNGGANLSG